MQITINEDHLAQNLNLLTTQSTEQFSTIQKRIEKIQKEQEKIKTKSKKSEANSK